jgi:RNA polymerase sigma-70 factor (ECF subfamily)
MACKRHEKGDPLIPLPIPTTQLPSKPATARVIMSEALSNDQFMDLLTQHQGRIFGYIFAAVQNLSDAEELYQETSIVLWRKFADYQPDTNFGHWACKVAKFEILHFLRTQRRNRICFSDQILSDLADIPARETDNAFVDHQQLLAGCVNELQPFDQQLVELCYGSHRTVKQIAVELQRSVQTLYNSLSRIRRLLFACVHRKLAEEDGR